MYDTNIKQVHKIVGKIIFNCSKNISFPNRGGKKKEPTGRLCQMLCNGKMKGQKIFLLCTFARVDGYYNVLRFIIES